MKRWPTKALGELVDFVGGGTPRRDRPDFWGGEIPWASVKDLQSQSLESTLETITPEGLRNSASNLIPKGAVIIASRVGLGKVAINRKPVAINQDLKALTPRSDNLIPRYLLYFLLQKAEYFERSGVGATVKGLTLADYQSLRIVLPPAAEQERIVSLFDEADELQKLRAQADSRAASLIPSLFNEMFGDPVKNPKAWPSRKLPELCEGREGIKAGPFGSALKKDCYTNEGPRVYGQEQVIAGNFLVGDYHISEAKYLEMSSYVVKSGDILISLVGTIGRVVVVPEGTERGIINPRLIRLRPRIELLNPIYLANVLTSPSVINFLGGLATGATMGVLNAGILKQLDVPVPAFSLQMEFAKRVTEFQEMEARQDTSRRRLDDLFRSMLHRAFTGDL